MKILIFALGAQEDIKNAFMEVGEVLYWDWSKHSTNFNASIRYLVQEHEPDLVFMQIQTPGIMDEATAAFVGSKTKVVNWTGDVRYPTPDWFLKIGRHIHLTLFTNMYDVEVCKKAGIRSEYLQIGFPDQIFKPNGQAQPDAPEIVFMGNNIGGFPLSALRAQMVQQLKKRYGKRFEYFGINWGRAVRSITHQHEEADYYRGAKVAINLSHFNYPRYSSDRLFRAMGAGCFVLSHDYPDHEKEFFSGKHFDVWKNIEQLMGAIDFYLNHDFDRKNIAACGCREVHENHTWANRVNQLLKML